ncbi:MAG: hypothetical protein ACI395_02690 [Candidatus Cryptobacteroides sp.]
MKGRVKYLILLFLAAGCAKLELEEPAEDGKDAGNRIFSAFSTGFSYCVAPVDDDTWIDASKTLQVRDEINRMAEGGINMVIVGSFKFMPMYFIDYSGTPYEEASQMPLSKVASQKETLLANIGYAHSKGIKVLSGSYSHYCPLSFWRAHQDELNPDGVFSDEWLLSVHQGDVFQSALNGSDSGVVPHQQWNNKCYKDFFVWSTEKMLEEIPTLDGFLNCYAESAWTYDINSLKAGMGESASRDKIQTDNDFIDYMNTLHDILSSKKGEDFEIGIRDWYMDMDLLLQTKIPASDIIVSVKYGGYDQPVIALPPWGMELKEKGFKVIFDMLVYDAEFPHPIYWYDADFISGIFTELRNGGVSGFAYQDYRAKSKHDEGNPLRLLTQRTVAAAVSGRSFTRNDALDYLSGIYGSAADPLLRSLECVTSAQSDNIKLTPAWFWKGDGLTVGGLAYNRLWKYADNSASEGGRMEFIRKDVVGIPEYCEAAILDVKSPGHLSDMLARWKSEGRRTPLEAVENMERQADEAQDAMLQARGMGGKGERFGEIFASSVIHRQMVLRDAACIRGTIDFVLSGGQIDGSAQSVTSSRDKMKDTGIHKESEAFAYFTEHVYRDLMLRELCARFAPRRPNLDDAKQYTYISKPCTALGRTFVLPQIDQNELQSLIDLIKN